MSTGHFLHAVTELLPSAVYALTWSWYWPAVQAMHLSGVHPRAQRWPATQPTRLEHRAPAGVGAFVGGAGVTGACVVVVVVVVVAVVATKPTNSGGSYAVSPSATEPFQHVCGMSHSI